MATPSPYPPRQHFAYTPSPHWQQLSVFGFPPPGADVICGGQPLNWVLLFSSLVFRMVEAEEEYTEQLEILISCFLRPFKVKKDQTMIYNMPFYPQLDFES